ncbi:SRPBCC family protein [Paenibacillus sp. GD4]|uniref:SRPBCC family protein n=1 Tax=Paenibacillus sp. GD4 TaxID=3068890 RepID=UPI002796D3A6|nr:SRPBCC family protein [Paenibacillus sp. GD4]MDQ1910789.1 SRPBCC family protein [Paenibacillus sp. GD4]
MVQGPSLGNAQTSVQGRELQVKRTFQAPQELVFDVWTDPKHLPNWWGPSGFTITIHSMEVKPGGAWRYIMHGPDGTDYDNVIRYLEVVRPERLVYNHGDTENEEQFHVTVTFVAQGNTTELTMLSRFPSAEDLQMAVEQYGAIEGAKQTLDRLEAELAKLTM